jgi:hypothetical protein
VCVSGDKRGLHEGRHVSLELDCCIPDLEAFYLERRPSVKLKGKLTIREPSVPAPRPEAKFHCEGRLWLGFWRGRMLTMNYKLRLTSPLTGATGQLRGTKFIRDDPGIDSFLDITTLHTVSTVPGRAKPMVGVVRVPMSNFISKQLPTFKLENAHDLDDTGKLWAAARFSQFFFGSLKETFLPELFVKKQVLR